MHSRVFPNTHMLCSQVLRLSDFTSQLSPPSLHTLAWPPGVWVTHNYATTVSVGGGTASSPAPVSLDQYLRTLGPLLLFPATGEVLVLSEREGDALLQLAWGLLPSGPAGSSTGANGSSTAVIPPGIGSTPGGVWSPVLLFLSHAGKGQSVSGLAPLAVRLSGGPGKQATSKATTGLQASTVLRLPPPAPSTAGPGLGALSRAAGGGGTASSAHVDPEGVPAPNLVALRFFNGETRYRGAGFQGDALMQALVHFLRSQQSPSGTAPHSNIPNGATGLQSQRRGREAAAAMVSMRGKGTMLARSDLERACDIAARPWLA
jgi:hypothetical protein